MNKGITLQTNPKTKETQIVVVDLFPNLDGKTKITKQTVLGSYTNDKEALLHLQLEFAKFVGMLLSQGDRPYEDK